MGDLLKIVATVVGFVAGFCLFVVLPVAWVTILPAIGLLWVVGWLP